MKKFLFPAVALIVLLLGFAFMPNKDKATTVSAQNEQPQSQNPITKAVDSVVGKGASNLAEKYINDMLENPGFFTVKEKNFNKGDSSSNGYFIGVISKDELKKSLNEAIEALSSEELREKYKDANVSVDEIFPQDVEFRYDYDIAHSVANIAEGAQIDGKVKILTPYYWDILKQFFKTEDIITTHTVIGTDIKFSNKLSDVDYAQGGAMLNLTGFEIGGTSDLGGEKIKAINVKMDKFFAYGLKEIDLEFGGLNYDVTYKDGVKSNAELVDYFLADMDYSSNVKNLVITVDGDRFFVANDATSSGKAKVSGGRYAIDDNSAISTLKIADVLVRNVKIDSNLEMSEKLYREMAFANEAKIEEYSKNPQALKELLQDDILMNISNLSFENSVGKKLSLSANGMVGEYIDEEKLFAKSSANGSLTIDTSVGEFIADYDMLRPFAPIAELYANEFLIPDGNGVRLDFSYDKSQNLLKLNNKTLPLE